jgi:hypothetical protein
MQNLLDPLPATLVRGAGRPISSPAYLLMLQAAADTLTAAISGDVEVLAQRLPDHGRGCLVIATGALGERLAQFGI